MLAKVPPITVMPLVTLAVLLAGCRYVRAPPRNLTRVPALQSQRDSGHAPVNGINITRRCTAERGVPLVLLHGGRIHERRHFQQSPSRLRRQSPRHRSRRAGAPNDGSRRAGRIRVFCG